MYFARSPSAKRRRLEQEERDQWQYSDLVSRSDSMGQTSSQNNLDLTIRRPSKSYQIYTVASTEESVVRNRSVHENGSSLLVRLHNDTQKNLISTEQHDSCASNSKMKVLELQAPGENFQTDRPFSTESRTTASLILSNQSDRSNSSCTLFSHLRSAEPLRCPSSPESISGQLSQKQHMELKRNTMTTTV